MPHKTDDERSELTQLNSNVMHCINYRIQNCNIPRDLHASVQTWELHRQIAKLQRELKDSVRRDYERQRANILSKREANK